MFKYLFSFLAIILISIIAFIPASLSNKLETLPKFVLPPRNDLKILLKDYRKNLNKVSNLTLSGLHWNQGIIVYSNKHNIYKTNHIKYQNFLQAIDSGEDGKNISFSSYPTGTILLKENYLLDKGKIKQPLTITIMIKEKTSQKKTINNWKFIQFTADGNIIVEGNNENSNAASCINCHKNVSERDYIFSTIQ